MVPFHSKVVFSNQSFVSYGNKYELLHLQRTGSLNMVLMKRHEDSLIYAAVKKKSVCERIVSFCLAGWLRRQTGISLRSARLSSIPILVSLLAKSGLLVSSVNFRVVHENNSAGRLVFAQLCYRIYVPE